VRLSLTSARVIRSFFFHEKTVTGAVYLDMLEKCDVPKVPDGNVFKKNGATLHFWSPVTEFLNHKFTVMSIN
jgi:hypothetical protein